MNNFFATPEGGWGNGSVHLTTVGIAIVIAVIALLLIVAAIVRHKNATHKSALTTKQLVYSAVAIALAVVCSMIKLFDMPMGLPSGCAGRHYDRSGLRSGTVRAGADFLHNPADALGLSAGIRCSGSCRFL